MNRLILLIFLFSSLITSAGNIKLNDGTIVFWEDKTGTVNYNSYRVEVRLMEPCKQNVIGSVSLDYLGTVYRGDNNLFIPAGELKGYVDFSNLDNGCRYNIRVNISDYKEIVSNFTKVVERWLKK